MRRVVLVGFPQLQILDVTGPLEVFATATRLGADPGYTCELVTGAGGNVATSGGLTLVADGSCDTCRGPIDTLVVAGGTGTPAAVADRELVAWIRGAATRTRRVTSVCSGAFLLARAGLLDGRRATTHWSVSDELQARFPAVEVDADRIFVHDDPVWTSAGVTAGMDLALALVEADHGRALALEVARWLVLFAQRPGGQAQFSAQLSVQQAERQPLREVQAFIAEHLDADLSVPTLAAHAGMSTRTFARAFRREVGTTPAAFVEAIRVEGARRFLEDSERGVGEIARACGFGTVETMHRAFRRTVHTTPAEYRRHFAATV